MAGPEGSWEGSEIGEGDIQYHRDTKWLPPAEAVSACAPGAERISEPREGEHVVFYAHFARWFVLPASLFFLEVFGLQPHHLGANTVVQLADFVTLCEGFLGVMLNTNLWGNLFFLNQRGVTAGTMSDCGASVSPADSTGRSP